MYAECQITRAIAMFSRHGPRTGASQDERACDPTVATFPAKLRTRHQTVHRLVLLGAIEMVIGVDCR